MCVLSGNLSKSGHDKFDKEVESNELLEVFIAQSSIAIVA